MRERSLSEIPARLETEHLVLRPYALGEGPWYFRMVRRNADHIEGTAIRIKAKSEIDGEFQVRKLLIDWATGKRMVFGIWEKETQAFIGEIRAIAVDTKMPEYELQGFADRDSKGRGKFVEAFLAMLAFAFDDLGVHRLCATVFGDNQRSLHFMDRSGFVGEGIYREAARKRDGTLVDIHVYGMLRSDYEKLRAGPGFSHA